eukprot:SAG25_NODE_94_length_15935_cov_41.063463_8_plen_171_part_00
MPPPPPFVAASPPRFAACMHAQRAAMQQETRDLVLSFQAQSERAVLEESLMQWRPKGGRSSASGRATTSSAEGALSAIDANADTSSSEQAMDQSRPQSVPAGGNWQRRSSSRLSLGQPLLETECYRSKMAAENDPLFKAGRRRREKLTRIVDFLPTGKSKRDVGLRRSSP